MKVKIVNRSAYPTPTYYNAINTTVSNNNWNVAFKRVLTFFCLSCMCCACSRPDDLADLLDGYVFHDESYKGHMKSDDNYYLVCKQEKEKEIEQQLADLGLLIHYGPQEYLLYDCGYGVPELLQDCRDMCVKGPVDIETLKDLDGLVYCHNMYVGGVSAVIGRTNVVRVSFVNEQELNHHLDKIIALADLLKIDVVNVEYDSRKSSIYLACTNISQANSVEVINCLTDRFGFTDVVLSAGGFVIPGM